MPSIPAVTVEMPGRSVGDGPEVVLSDRGNRLWHQLMSVRVMAPHEVALVDEICRVRDRMDRLDALLLGDDSTWARIEWDVRSRSVTLVIDDALGEARQQAALFKTLLQALKLPESVVAAGGKSLVEQLSDARAARRAAARGSASADRVAPAGA